MKRLACSIALLALTSVVSPRPASAQGQYPYLGEIQLFPFNFCPTGWIPADGQLLQISQNTALFSLFGVMYGGDGVTTFGVPKWGPTYASNGGPFTACIATQGIFPSRN